MAEEKRQELVPITPEELEAEANNMGVNEDNDPMTKEAEAQKEGE